MAEVKIKRYTCTDNTVHGFAGAMASAYRADGFRELLISHDGKVADTDAAQCGFGDTIERLKLIAGGAKKIVVVIDNQPTFFCGRKFSPNKSDVVESAIADAMAHCGDKLALIYVVD